MCATPSSGRYSIVTSAAGRRRARSTRSFPGHDNRAVALDLRGERCAQRELHIRGGELEAVAVRAQQHAGENLYRPAGRDDARNRRERGNELISIARDLEARTDRYVYFTNHLKNLLS